MRTWRRELPTTRLGRAPVLPSGSRVESGQNRRGLGPPLPNGLTRWAEHCGGGVGGFIGLILRRMAPTQKMLEGCGYIFCLRMSSPKSKAQRKNGFPVRMRDVFLVETWGFLGGRNREPAPFQVAEGPVLGLCAGSEGLGR